MPEISRCTTEGLGRIDPDVAAAASKGTGKVKV